MTHLVYLLKMSSISIEPPENASQFFRSFILRTLRKDPKERPTAAELIEDPFITQLSEESCIEIIRTLVKSSLLHKNKDEYEEEWEEEEEEEEGEEEEEK
ncbi:hypothetical protein TRFO_08962 [Tritrichomonas foetus]|uniref:Protein kinase domain-containing protein n=1 Tax=Tritrichomonas foetus TaxID=1144522 RepID=A0A1J4JGR2_9EUKA|nr:hypothetical protein TRFO_08962 [Tritrichomonas foetus]|eukprot:OHS98366.1 hypothetical protein TRFO_08962 [Tritrichomonas foetus]